MRSSVWRLAPRAARAAALLSIVLLVSLASGRESPAQSMPIEDLSRFPRTTLTITAHGRAERFRVWIANTPARQEQGLMFVRDLPASQGMLFPEDSPQVAQFWMKNTYIPLDMVFVGEDHRIEKIIARATPFSEAILSSDEPVIAVLELAGGDTQARGIRVGDPVSWTIPGLHGRPQ
jgi:uncharacterized protein